jgi:hypothetical protein
MAAAVASAMAAGTLEPQCQSKQCMQKLANFEGAPSRANQVYRVSDYQLLQ